MTRRQRQVDELRGLCGSGAVARAVDLAFEHFVCFGRDDRVIALLIEAIERAPVPQDVRHRLAELIGPVAVPPDAGPAPHGPA